MPHPVRDLMAAAERETAAAPLERWRMHRSHRFLLRMAIFLGLVAALEWAADPGERGGYPFQLDLLARPWQVDLRMVVRFPGPAGMVEHTFNFGQPVESEKVSAKWNSGLLAIVLPKKRGRRVTVE